MERSETGGTHKLSLMGGRSKRHRNMITSIAVCVALIAGYYLSIGQATIPPDTRIVLERRDALASRIEITADGAATYGQHHYKLSKFAVRRVLRVFSRAHFLDLDPAAYHAAPSQPVCTLSLTSAHRKVAIRHRCGDPALEIAKPVAAVEQALRPHLLSDD